MASLKELKGRINSVKSTQKITKAKQMVAAAKLRKAQAAAEAGRPYAQRLASVMASLASKIAGQEGAPKLFSGTGSDQRHLLVVANSDKGLAGVWFEGQRHLPPQLVKPYVWREAPEHPVLRQAITQLSEYYAGTRTVFDLPLDLGHGTAFQQSVWQALLAIPQGGTLSYGQVSQRIGKPEAVRAVGAAVGRNPLSVIVPCHRVLGSNGSLTGYAGGLHRKTALLKLEGALQESML